VTEAGPTTSPPDGDPLWRRIVGTIAAPGPVFRSLGTNTPWVGPLLVVIVAGVAIVLLIPEELFVREAREGVRRAAERGATAPSIEQVAAVARIAAVVGGAVATPVMAFIVAGLLALVFSVVGDGDATYVQYLTVTTHSMVITALGGVVTLPVQILAGDLRAGLTLAALAPDLFGDAVAGTVAQGIDPFTLWALVVTGVGVAAVNGRRDWLNPASVVVGLYLLALVGIALISA
jgi:hypothetical protein